MRPARLKLVGSAVGLVTLAAVLPGPGSWPALLSGLRTGAADSSSLDEMAQQAILVSAGLLVWALLVWSLAVGCAALATRLPGAPGRFGRSLLRRIAPGAASRVIVAAVGISVLAGTSGCAVPVFATAGSGSSTETPATLASDPTTAMTTMGPETPTAPPTPVTQESTANAVDQARETPVVIGSITIDWPESEPAVDPVASAVPAADPPATTSSSASAPETPVSDASPATAPSPAQPPTTVDPPPVRVHSGDTLWSIARDHLPPDAGYTDIDTAWRAWYSTNGQVIGDDPDLIQPGQQLLPPVAESGR